MSKFKKDKKSLPLKKSERFIGKVASKPAIHAIAQLANPIAGIIFGYYAEKLRQERFEALKELVLRTDKKLEKIGKDKLDKRFFESPQGHRTLRKTAAAVLDDSRKEKLEAASTLLANFAVNSKLSYDEREYLADTLDALNSFHLTILHAIAKDVFTNRRNHRGFGWERLRDLFKERGVSKHLVTSALSTLEAMGLVNKNSATITEEDKTHFFTEFGEKFYDFTTGLQLHKASTKKN